jgi:prepilin-type processing-associated H-X9-DG protein
MFFESAGRPNLYDRNKALLGTMWDDPVPGGGTPRAMPGQATTAQNASHYQWADREVYGLWGNSPAGCGITSVMNCDNYAEIFSFHPGGANIVFGDGSVDLIGEDVDIDTFVSLITRAAEDLVGDY